MNRVHAIADLLPGVTDMTEFETSIWTQALSSYLMRTESYDGRINSVADAIFRADETITRLRAYHNKHQKQ